MRLMHEKGFNLEFSIMRPPPTTLHLAPINMLYGNSWRCSSGPDKLIHSVGCEFKTFCLIAAACSGYLLCSRSILAAVTLLYGPARVHSNPVCIQSEMNWLWQMAALAAARYKHTDSYFFGAHVNNLFAFRWRIVRINFCPGEEREVERGVLFLDK